MPALELRNITSGYNGKQVLQDITFTAKESLIYVVLGPNGAGKTTLFRTIAGVLKPYSGKILLNSHEIENGSASRGKINYLSHYNALPEEMSVYNALRFYSDMEGGDPEEMIRLLDLEKLRDKRISDLSQGTEEEGLNWQGLPQGEGGVPA